MALCSFHKTHIEAENQEVDIQANTTGRFQCAELVFIMVKHAESILDIHNGHKTSDL